MTSGHRASSRWLVKQQLHTPCIDFKMRTSVKTHVLKNNHHMTHIEITVSALTVY